MKKKNLKIKALDPACNKKNAGLLWAYHIIMMVLAAVCVGLCTLVVASANFGIPMLVSYFKIPMLIALNLAPVVFILLVSYLLIGRAWLAFFIPSAIIFFGSGVNYYKLALRNDPLYFEDLKLFTEMVNITKGNYTLEFAPRVVIFGACVVLGTIALYFLCPGKMKAYKTRIAALILLAVVGFTFFPKYYLSDSVYLKVENNGLINIWSDTQRYISRGFVYPFFNSITKMSDPAPEGYSEEAALALLDKYGDDAMPEDKKPHIIGIMLEAFNDLTKFDSLEINPEVYEVWHELKAENYSGELVTNIFAGGTIDTERCFLTGFSSLGSFRTPSWSYVHYLRDNGYVTEGAHPGYEWFYNRLNANINLGFDRYFFTENHFKYIYDNNVAPDSVLFPDIIANYEEHKDEGPYFNFSVTYQNHGPYEIGKLYYGDNHILNEGISDESRDILNNYLGGIKDTQKELKTMLDTLNEESEPIFVVLFGDHNPWLGDGNSVYIEMGVDILGESDEAFFNYYSTPYIIWANDAAKARYGDIRGEGEPISPCYLMSELFELMDIEGPAYNKMLGELKEVLPVTHTTGRRVENGQLVGEVSEKAEKMLGENRIVRYYLRKDAMK
ncbi:MAG: sulfatase-like hydrolase/transferase [Clostridia bacterium]|nr:sulfatase-like hydrolase/transferase [Clostridia bacterium]